MMTTKNISLTAFVSLLSLTMVGEGMITVTLLWTSASIGQSPLFIGIVLFVMNLVPFIAQFLFKPLRKAIEDSPVRMIIAPRMLGVVAAVFAGMTFNATSVGPLIVIASCLTFITFISQQCIETLMGQLTVAGVLDAKTSARLSQTALQTGVFIGNALAGLVIARFGTSLVFYGIAVSFASSLLLLLVAPSLGLDTHNKSDGSTPKTVMAAATQRNDVALWVLLIGMGALAVQLSGFNFFVPLIYEGRSGDSAAVYGSISAAAGIGALVATFLSTANRWYLAYASCLVVVVGDIMVVQTTSIIAAILFAFGIGFGFNTSRIAVRQAIFERLSSKADSAVWGGRVTLAFRAVAAGAPLLFGLLLTGQTITNNSWLFTGVGILVMGILIPLLMFVIRQKSPVANPA
ncbi:MFS transporter [Rhizobium sp.]|jgi:hypothetical protein|uniref:MFS transporter n=1 Tax=Rhizobium sp. TaxID=391 RepID=UPI000E7D649C|nr:hypothetical protein [Rhizobium sp.]